MIRRSSVGRVTRELREGSAAMDSPRGIQVAATVEVGECAGMGMVSLFGEYSL
jgi:hypothetical protein